MTTKITGENVTDGTILNVDVNPSAIDPNNTEINNLFNIGVIGFKMAVNEGLTVFNLVDGVVDEFHSEGGVDTAEIGVVLEIALIQTGETRMLGVQARFDRAAHQKHRPGNLTP